MTKAGRPARAAVPPATPASPPPTQRIDRFLWFVRLAPDRARAQALAERGIIRLNGRRIGQAHAPVRVGDLVTLPQGPGARVIRIVALPVRRGPPAEAQSCYEAILVGESDA